MELVVGSVKPHIGTEISGACIEIRMPLQNWSSLVVCVCALRLTEVRSQVWASFKSQIFMKYQSTNLCSYSITMGWNHFESCILISRCLTYLWNYYNSIKMKGKIVKTTVYYSGENACALEWEYSFSFDFPYVVIVLASREFGKHVFGFQKNDM